MQKVGGAAAFTHQIHSPSKVMWRIGLASMQGLALGITNNAYLPVAAMVSVMKKLEKVPIRLGGAGSFVGGGGGVGPSIYIKADFTIIAPGGNAASIMN